VVHLSRPTALNGEFKLSLKFEWTSKDTSPETNTAMQVLLINLRDYAGNIVISQGYIDENIDKRGSPVGAIGIGPDLIEYQMEKYKQAAAPDEFANSLAASGIAEITIQRDAKGKLVGTFNGGGKKQVITGTSKATVAQVELELRRFIHPGATFEGLALDRISVTGKNALQDKATAKTIRDAMVKSEAERTDADKTLLAEKAPRTLVTDKDFQLALLAKPALKAQIDKVTQPKVQKATTNSQLKPAGKAISPGSFITALSLSPDGTKLAIGGENTVALLDTTNGKIEKVNFKDPVTNADRGQLLTVQYAASGKLAVRRLLAAQGDERDSILMRDMETGAMQKFPISRKGVHFGVKVLQDDHYVMTIARPIHVFIYHVEKGPVGGFVGPIQPANAIAVSSDQRFAAVGYEHGLVVLLKMPTADELNAATPIPADKNPSMEVLATWRVHTQPIWDIAFSPDSKRLASGDKGGTVCLWNVDSKDNYAAIEGTFVAFSPDSAQIVSMDGGNDKKRLRSVVWDVATGKALHMMRGGGYAFPESPPAEACWDKTGKKVFISEGFSIVTWNVPEKK